MHPPPSFSASSSSVASSSSQSPLPASPAAGAESGGGAAASDVSALWSRVAPSALLSHLNSLYVAMSSVGLLPPVCEQVHLGVVEAGQFRALMELLHAVQRRCNQPDAAEQTGKGGPEGATASGQAHANAATRSAAAAVVAVAAVAADDSTLVSSTSLDGDGLPTFSSLYPPASSSHQPTSPVYAADAVLSPPSSRSDALGLQQQHSSSSSSSTSSASSSPVSSPPAAPSSSRVRAVRSSVFSSSSSSGRGDRDSGVDRERFCKPSRLITVYPSKPFLITPVHLERIYVTSRKAAECMSDEEKAELATITVRWMGKPTAEELFLVATDVCALINIRKSNTAKTVAQFADGEKVSMPVHCSSGKGSSTHILTVLTLAGVRRLLTTSRSVLATSLLDYLTRIAVHLQHFPHYVPVNDPLKPTVTPLKPEQQTQLVANPATTGLTPLLMTPPASAVFVDKHPVSVSAPEPSMFASLPYPSDAQSVSVPSTSSSFLSPVVATLSSAVSDQTADANHVDSVNSRASPPSSISAVLLSSCTSARTPPESASIAVNGISCWTVKREHEASDIHCGERVMEDRPKKRKVADSGTGTADQLDGLSHQQRPTHYHQEPQPHMDTNTHSPLPLPLVDDRGSPYAATMPHAMSNGPQSPLAPDSPSGLSYSHFHPPLPSGGLVLPPLHYNHSPPFMSTQPPALPFNEGSELMYAPGPWHPPYYHQPRHHAYCVSPQHRPLTAPPMQPFSHHTLAQHSKPNDDYGISTQQQQTHGVSSGLTHTATAIGLPTNGKINASGNSNTISQNITAQRTADGEPTLPPLYQPSPLHTHPTTCTHCQHNQQQQQQQPHAPSVAVYGQSNRRAPQPPISPPPPPQPPTTAAAAGSYHTAYGHNQLAQHTAPRNSLHAGPYHSYAHTTHHSFHHTRYAAS